MIWKTYLCQAVYAIISTDEWLINVSSSLPMALNALIRKYEKYSQYLSEEEGK